MIALRQLAGDVPVALGLSVAQAVGYLERGLSLAEALGDRAMEVDLLARMAVIAANRLRFNESLEHGRRAVAIARTVHDEVVLAAALDGLKTGYAYLGEIAELVDVIAELEPLLRRQDDRFRLHWTVFESAFPFLAAAQWDDALARIETAASINREVGYTIYEAWYDAHVAWVHRMRGDLAQALEFGRRAVRSAGVEHPWWQVTANTMLATTLARSSASATKRSGCSKTRGYLPIATARRPICSAVWPRSLRQRARGRRSTRPTRSCTAFRRRPARLGSGAATPTWRSLVPG